MHSCALWDVHRLPNHRIRRPQKSLKQVMPPPLPCRFSIMVWICGSIFSWDVARFTLPAAGGFWGALIVLKISQHAHTAPLASRRRGW